MGERSQIVDLSKKSLSIEDDLDEEIEAGKMVKMRDLDSFLRCREIKRCSKLTEAKAHKLQDKEEETSQITDAAASLHSDKSLKLMTRNSSAETINGMCLSLGVDSIKSNEPTKPDKEPCLNVDLNVKPFHPNKILGQVRSSDASECGSTTGPLEESEPLRMWKEMKQNGFLSSSSSSHGGIPVPKQRGRQPKRKKEEEIKKKGDMKKSDITKREQPNKYAKTAAPTGLLSGLNPGIIKHVRNSKQVNSIIAAVLQSENTYSQVDHRPADQFGNQFGQHQNQHFLSILEDGGQIIGSNVTAKIYHESSMTPQCNVEIEDESLKLKLSSAVTVASKNTSSAFNDDLSTCSDAIAFLSLKGASVASQWLDLLQQDIKGRLSALRRSRKRVRNVIQTELPYLLSKEISSEGGSSKKASLDVHMARWTTIFSQMDKALYEEGKHLENWLQQVEDLHSHCEGGLKYFSTNHTLLHAEEFSGTKNPQATEKENAVRAAAASIYSTCNFILPKENAPCF